MKYRTPKIFDFCGPYSTGTTGENCNSGPCPIQGPCTTGTCPGGTTNLRCCNAGPTATGSCCVGAEVGGSREICLSGSLG